VSVVIKLPGGEPVVANDVCDQCGEPVLVPVEAVRCEWGCCYLDASEASLARGYVRATHECRECHQETHRFGLAHLVEMAQNGEPYAPARGTGRKDTPAMKARWEAYDAAARAWRASRLRALRAIAG
jgi:hypothetical protein